MFYLDDSSVQKRDKQKNREVKLIFLKSVNYRLEGFLPPNLVLCPVVVLCKEHKTFVDVVTGVCVFSAIYFV